MDEKLLEDTAQTESESVAHEIVTVDTNKLIETIKTTDSIQDFLPLFNDSIARKQAMRILKREEIIDKVTEQIEERLDKRPDEISLVELNAIDKTMSEQKQKELSVVNTNTQEATPFNLNQQNNTINVTVNSVGLEKESKERVIDAVKEMLKIAKSTAINDESEEDAIDEPQK